MSVDSSDAAVVVAPTRLEALAAAVAAALPGKLQAVANHTRELTFEVPAAQLLETAAVLRDGADLKFEMCMDVCGVDYLEHGRAEWKTEDATTSGFSRGVSRWDVTDEAAAVSGRRGWLANSWSRSALAESRLGYSFFS